MEVKGKYFVLISRNGGKALALDIKGGQPNVGTDVVLCDWDFNGKDSQVWFQEPITGTIRSKANPDLCLDMNDAGRLCLNHPDPDKQSQRWQYDKHRDVIENRDDPNKVLDVVGASTDSGAEVCSLEYHGRDNQRWTVEHQPASYFYIESKRSGQVLDVEGNQRGPGVKVIMGQREDDPSDNQLWFEDSLGNIRSKLDEDNILDPSDGSLRTNRHEDGSVGKFWAILDDRIVNVYNQEEVLTAKGYSDGAEVYACQSNGKANQQWNFEYV